MRALLLVVIALVATGCPDGSGDCPYSVGDACITAENLEQCQEMSASCPGRVTVMESCPLQFGCDI